jgi:transposase
MPTCLIGMEACVGANHLSRQLLALGHDVKLIPAQLVTPFPYPSAPQQAGAHCLERAEPEPHL